MQAGVGIECTGQRSVVIDMEDGRRWRRHVDQLRPRTVKPQVNPGGWGGMRGWKGLAKRLKEWSEKSATQIRK